MNNNKSLIIGIIVITVLIFGGLVWAITSAPQSQNVVTGPEQGLTFDDADAPSQGPANAKVVVHLEEDLECPACKEAHPAMMAALQKYANASSSVRFVWKDFPLEQIHKNSRLAANAGRCAQDQNKFWEFQNRAYEEQGTWGESGEAQTLLATVASDAGLNVNQFTTCLAARPDDARVQHDSTEGLKNNVDRTPTVFINNQRYFAMSVTEWDAAIQQALSLKPSS